MDTFDRYVLSINENHSLTKTAKEFGISQPALSSALNTIEKKLGYHLFNRKKTPIETTKEGEIYVEHLKKILVLEHDLKKRIEDMQSLMKSTLTIGAPGTYVDSILLGAVGKFIDQNTDCNIKIIESTVPELIKKTKNNEVDLFVSTSAALPEGFEVEHINQENIFICIPEKWEINKSISKYQIKYNSFGGDVLKDNNCKILPINYLEGLSLIFLNKEQPLQVELNRYFSEQKFEATSIVEVDQVRTALQLAISGVGVCFASSSVLDITSELEKVCIYRLDRNVFQRDIYVAYSKEHYMSENAKKILDIIQNSNIK